MTASDDNLVQVPSQGRLLSLQPNGKVDEVIEEISRSLADCAKRLRALSDREVQALAWRVRTGAAKGEVDDVVFEALLLLSDIEVDRRNPDDVVPA